MLAPLWVGGVDSEPGRGHEAKMAVEVGIPQEGDKRFARRVGGAEDGMHHRLAHSLALIGRQNTDRPQAERGSLTDPSAGTHDVANDLLVVDRHHRECGDPSAVASKRSQQTCLGRLMNAAANGERSRGHSLHRAEVFSNLTPDDQRPSV